MKKFSPIFIVALCLCAGYVAAVEKTIENPDWSFQDDFEGAEDNNFWLGGAAQTHGATCSSDPNSSGKSLLLTYPTMSEGGHSWAEKRFVIPVNAQQLEISYNQFVPANYKASPGNHKNFVLWSGKYGNAASNIFIGSEDWPTSSGATPSVYIGADGTNYEHSSINARPLMMENNQGSWQRMHIYVELAEREGDFGVFEIHRDREFLTGTSHPDIKPSWGQPPVDEHIEYSSRGNYIDQGYLMGWANGGFTEETVFCIDDFTMKVNTVIKKPASATPPSAPSQLRIEQ